MAQTSSFRIFVSSTFRDFDRERDTLRRVEIALRERLVPFGATVTLVDLRWGVQVAAAEGEREAEILQVCLDEVARTRPLFVGLLGDRYGWVPDDSIATTATAHRQFGRSLAGRSVTEMEIEYGVLTDDLVGGNAAFFFRTMSPRPPVGFAEEPGSSSERALDVLKQRVRDAGVSVVDYEVDVAADGSYATDAFERAATETIWGLLAPQLQRSSVDPATPVHEGFASELVGLFVDPDDRIARIRSRLDAMPEIVHVVTGTPGSGRSSTLAALAHHHRAAGGQALFHSVPLERAGHGSAAERLVRFAGLEEGRSVRDAVHALDGGPGPVLVCLDAIDRSTRASERALSWLPDPLPPGVRVVVSCDSWPDYATRGVEVEVIDALFPDRAVREMIRGRFAHLSKSVPPAVVDELANRAAVGGPLWTSVAVDLLAGLDVADFAQIDRDALDPQQALADLLVEVARGLSSLLSDLYEELFDRARRQVAADALDAVSRAVTYTAAGLPTREAGAVASALAGRVIDDLELARVRWALRGQIASHGSTGWLTPAHDALRRTVAGSTFGQEAEVRAVIARALATLRSTSPFAASEFLAQCLWLGSAGGLALALVDAVGVDRTGDGAQVRRMLAAHLTSAPAGARLVESVLAEPGLSVAAAWVVRGAVRDSLEDGLGGAARVQLVEALLAGVATRAGSAAGTDSIDWHDVWAAVVYDRAYWLGVPDPEWIEALEQATGAWRTLVDHASDPAAVAVRLAHAETDLARALASTDAAAASERLSRTEATLAALDLARLPAYAPASADIHGSRVAVVRALASVDDARMFLASSTAEKRRHLRAQLHRLWSLLDAVHAVAEPSERHRAAIDDVHDDLARASVLLADHSGTADGAVALANLDRALATIGAALADAPSMVVLVRAMGQMHRARAELLVRLGDPTTGVGAAHRSRRMFGVVAAISAGDPEAVIDVIRATALAGDLEARHGDRTSGLGLLHDAVALALELLDPDLGSASAADAASQSLVVTTVLHALDTTAELGGSPADGYGAPQLFTAGSGLMTLIDQSDHLAWWEREGFHAELALARAERLSRDADHGRALTDLAYAIGVADDLVARGVTGSRLLRSKAYARASDCAERRLDRPSAARYLRAAIDELGILVEESEDPAIESQRGTLEARWADRGY